MKFGTLMAFTAVSIIVSCLCGTAVAQDEVGRRGVWDYWSNSGPQTTYSNGAMAPGVECVVTVKPDRVELLGRDKATTRSITVEQEVIIFSDQSKNSSSTVVSGPDKSDQDIIANQRYKYQVFYAKCLEAVKQLPLQIRARIFGYYRLKPDGSPE